MRVELAREEGPAGEGGQVTSVAKLLCLQTETRVFSVQPAGPAEQWPRAGVELAGVEQ